jgi:TP901 family phage tail tape measure protein
MDIDLGFKSPGLTIPRLDEELGKMQKLNDLMSTMGRTVKIDLQITGAGNLTSTIDQMNRLAASLRLVGMNSAADALKSGQLSGGERSAIANAVKARLEEEQRAYDAARSRYIQHKTSFDALDEKGKNLNLSNAEANMLPQVLAKINREKAEMDRAFSRVGMLQQVKGMAEALQGVDFQGAAEGNKELAGAAATAATAVNAETAAVNAQAAAMDRLETATRKVARAKKEAIADTGGGSLIAERTTNTSEGKSVVSTYRMGQGETRKYTGTSEVFDNNKLASFREKAAAIEANLAQSMVGARAAQKPVLSANAAEALRKLYEEMGDLGGTVFGQGLLRKSATLDGKSAGWMDDAIKRGLLGDAQNAAKAGDWWDGATKVGLLGDFRVQSKANSWWDNATKVGALGDFRSQSKSMDWWDNATKAGLLGDFRAQSKSMDWWDGAVRKASLDEARTAEKQRLEKERKEAADARAAEKRLAAEAKAAEKSGLLGRYGRNLASISMWSAGTATLYSGLSALGNGVGQAVGLDRQYATLGSVYRHGEEGAKGLADQTLRLAVATGRGADEAIAAATKWSRLGLTQREAAEAVRVTAMAANVAEISMAEAAENLSAIMTSYSLEVSDLNTVLNEMNSISNTLNVTVKDLMDGIARTGAVAKQAGVPLSELMGFIGAGVGATGRPGAEFGNAIKSTIVSLSNPEVQGYLRKRFDFDVFNPGGSQKDMSTIFRELFVRSSGMTAGDKGELLQKIGGKNQASRLEAMLDNYLTAQERSISAQRDMNSAQREGARILETTESKLASLGSAWGRFWSNVYQSGGKKTVNSALDAVTGMLGSDWFGKSVSGFAADPINGLARLFNPFLPMSEQGAKGQRGYMARKAMDENDSGWNEAIQSAIVASRNAAAGAGAEAQAMKNASMFIQNPALATVANMRSLGRMFGGSIKEQDSYANELAGLVGKSGLNARIQELSDAAEVRRAESQRRSDAEAKISEFRMEQAIAEQEKTVTGLSLGGDEGLIAKSKSRLDELRNDLNKLRTERKKYADESEAEYNSPAVLTFRESSTGRQAGVGRLYDGASMIGDFERDRLARQREKEAAMRALADSMDRDSELGEFNGFKINDNDRRAMRGEAANIRIGADRLKKEIEMQTPFSDRLDNLRIGREAAAREMSEFGVGLNDTERLFNKVDGAGSLIGRMGTGDVGIGGDIELGNQLVSARNALLERQHSIVADIANEQMRQNEEASKALMMASKADQLQAALLAKYQQEKGPLSGETFMFMSEASRSAAAKYVPSIMPGGAGALGDLQREKSALDAGLPAALERVQSMIETLRAETKLPPAPQLSMSIGVADSAISFMDRLQQIAVERVDAKFGELSGRLDGFLEMMMPGGGVN